MGVGVIHTRASHIYVVVEHQRLDGGARESGTCARGGELIQRDVCVCVYMFAIVSIWNVIVKVLCRLLAAMGSVLVVTHGGKTGVCRVVNDIHHSM